MKILWLNWRCWLNPAMGGAEVFTHEVAKSWVSSGHEVCLFTSHFPNSEKEEIADGVRIVRAGGRFSVYQEAREFYAKRFKTEGFDVIIDEINTRPFFAPKFVKSNSKVVALIHQLAREYWFYETPFPVSYFGYHFLENRWLRQYVDVPTITVSESTRKDLSDLGFKNVTVVQEGLNFEPLSTLPAKNHKPTVIFAGRLKRSKRPDHAIKAFKIVKTRVPDAEMWVFGDGPFRQKLEQMAGKGVKFLGDLPSIERRSLIAQGWVLVNPAVREGWGLNVIEANALGVSCIAYNVHGLRDSIKNGETGLLVEAGNIVSLAESIISLLVDERKRQRLSLEALRYAKRFNWDKTAEQFMKSCC
jgi:glycosyltransferase involved in cell wall biosynthesis